MTFALAGQAAGAAGHVDGDPNLTCKLINFAILAAGIGYVAVKVLFPAFRKQQGQILETMASAERRAAEVAEEAAAIDRRVAGIGDDIAALRAKAYEEMGTEAERLARETEAAIVKLQRSAELEIASIAKAARQDLKVYSAGLALDLARQRLEARIDGPAQDALIARFAAALKTDMVERN